MWQKRASQLTSREGIRGLIWVISLNVTGQFTHPSPSWVFHRANTVHRLTIFTPTMAITFFKKLRWWKMVFFLPDDAELLFVREFCFFWSWVAKVIMRTFKLFVLGELVMCVLCTPTYKFPYYTFWRGIPRKPWKVYIPQLWSPGTRRNPSSRVSVKATAGFEGCGWQKNCLPLQRYVREV